jgi:hypothetical protein
VRSIGECGESVSVDDAASQKMHSPSLGPVMYSMRQGAQSGRSVMTGPAYRRRAWEPLLVFHVELRQFPHQTRAFNLTREELNERFVEPWMAGEPIELDDYRWLPDRATLTIYDAATLEVADMGLGRGWQNVTRKGRDVTQEVLIEARNVTAELPTADDFKAEVAARSAAGAIAISGLVELAGEWYPQARVSERIALCEGVVWELLHSVPVTLSRRGQLVPAYEWQAVLLTWQTWTDDGPDAASLEPL